MIEKIKRRKIMMKMKIIEGVGVGFEGYMKEKVSYV